ncbi:MAG: hypothetical protein HY651_03700 [Acidobacteria bacterium]|nr:hypothetical protein [Acidobacteriota bacterium]
MTTIGIHPSLIAKLVEAPETGMGYQVLQVQLESEVPRHVLVLNAEMAEEMVTEVTPLEKVIARQAQERILKALQYTLEKIHFHVLTRLEAVANNLVEKHAKRDGEGPASQADPELSEQGEQFLRYSAFRNDRRINSDGSVKPGTYVTTHADGMTHVKTGMDAVRRYALPKPKPAIYRFALDPPTRIQVRRGIVAPAYGQPGGGVEVKFDNGAPSGTFRPPVFEMEPGT